MNAPTIAMVAGEASGDLLASLLLGGLKPRWPQVKSFGIGGPAMQREGFDAWWPSEKLAVHGYSLEVLRRYRELLRIRNQLRDRLIRDRPAVFVGVDAPDFNLGLEAALRGAGVKTVHFVCPSIWAWRARRVDAIRRSASHVLCLFPFEPGLLAQHDIGATFVGHPLASVIPDAPDRSAARSQLGIDAGRTVVAVLPGSRQSEIRYLAHRFFRAVALIRQLRPDVHFVVPALPSLKTAVERAVRECGLAGAVQILDGQSHVALAACDVTLIASGTATLEAALFKRPMVIAYNMHPMSWQLMRRRRLQPWVGLPNILCKEFVVPELLQDAASPQALCAEVLKWLESPDKIAALQTRFSRLHAELKCDTATLAADAIEKVIES